MDAPVRKKIEQMLSELESEPAGSRGISGAAERARAALAKAGEIEQQLASGEDGFVQLPEPDGGSADGGPGAEEGTQMTDGAGGEVETMRRELQTVRGAYEDAKQRMIRFEQLHEELQEQIDALRQERETMRARIAELESQRSGDAESQETARTMVPNEAFEAFGPTGQKRRLGEILVEAGVINDQQLKEILAEQARRPQSRLGVLVVERGITSEEIVARVLAAQLRLPYVELDQYQIVEAAALQVPEDIARRHECIAIDGDLHSMTLAMANPLDLLAIENIEISCKRRVAAVVAKPSSVIAAIDRAYGRT